MTNLTAPMPASGTPFLRGELINEPWYRFLFQLQLRTGGSAGSDFATQVQLDALANIVDGQEMEINGLYPDPVIPQNVSNDAGFVPYAVPPDIGDGIVQFPVGSLSQQSADSVAITGGSIDGTPIGASTPSSGAFTTLSASTPVAVLSGGTGSSTASGARTNLGLGTVSTQNASAIAITGGSIDGTTVGSTTASSGSFTTIQASSTITPSQTAGIVGTTTNNSANAGSVGEFVTNNASGISVSTGVSANITSISLTAGDWDVTGQAVAVPAGSTALSQFAVAVNTTSATLPTATSGLGFTVITGSLGTGTNPVLSPMTTRISLSATTTVFLVASVNFTVSTCTVNGYIRARRIR